MAKMANPEASDDMYSDAQAGNSDQKPESQGDPEEQSESKSYLLPKAIAEGKDFKPGDEIVLRIVADHDDQFEVEYAPAKEQEKEPQQPETGGEPAGAPQGAGMQSMYE